ncbi:LacI family DNA-binding transcriptional regulator [Aquimarina hainanensis]|uniref:LacI family DNA-binding transcriptional regulator n=1 Tax=Aquimarina hainanensis TaxID=1578017 RepID=A0ABW5NAU9_9FLAO|nr:LacI family DNA-binding transcriptional regulator [Aquimarina sp. TRL1]QKX05502.1 LacI family DNA-binding transcriptional regulator [Aquimarina sp. TRL1]
MSKRITLKDISRLSGFSISTISKALHDDPDISFKTKRKIRELASVYNYVPNFLAKCLKDDTPNVIGISIPKIGDLPLRSLAREIKNIPQLKGKTCLDYTQPLVFFEGHQITQKMMKSDIAGIIVLLSDKK